MAESKGIKFVLSVRDDGSASINKFSRGMDKLGKKTDKSTRELKEFDRQTKKTTKTASAFGTAIKGLILTFGLWKIVKTH